MCKSHLILVLQEICISAAWVNKREENKHVCVYMFACVHKLTTMPTKLTTLVLLFVVIVFSLLVIAIVAFCVGVVAAAAVCG